MPQPAHRIPPTETGVDYDQDFFAWTAAQARHLRALATHLRGNPLDIDNLAAEVEDLGKRDRRAVESLLYQLCLHGLKLQFHPQQASRNNWMAEVEAFRRQLHRLFRDSPSLHARRLELYQAAWHDAEADFFTLLARETEVFHKFTRVSAGWTAPPYDLDTQILGVWHPAHSPLE